MHLQNTFVGFNIRGLYASKYIVQVMNMPLSLDIRVNYMHHFIAAVHIDSPVVDENKPLGKTIEQNCSMNAFHFFLMIFIK